jgi:hypothetical protein
MGFMKGRAYRWKLLMVGRKIDMRDFGKIIGNFQEIINKYYEIYITITNSLHNSNICVFIEKLLKSVSTISRHKR